MRELGARLGLHHTTVSLALRGSKRITEATRARVRALAGQLGYRPDPALASLNYYSRSRRAAAFQSIIAWVDNWPDPPGRLFNVHTYKAYHDGAAARAAELGYILEIFRAREPGMNPARLRQIFFSRNVGGLLLPPQERAGTSFDMDLSDFCALAFGYSLAQSGNLNLVTARHEQVPDLVIKNLRALGYRRPGYCLPLASDSGNNWTWITRWDYFTRRDPAAFTCIPRAPDVADSAALARWLRRRRPDVIVGFNNLLPHVESLGWRVPEDIGFCSVNIDPGNLRLAGINQYDFSIGRMAVDILVDMIHRNEKGCPRIPVRSYADVAWRDGATLPSRSGPARLESI
jgi:LacI family transcriptional regulator